MHATEGSSALAASTTEPPALSHFAFKQVNEEGFLNGLIWECICREFGKPLFEIK